MTAIATPTDRVYAWVRGGYRMLDYDFVGTFAGPLTMSGWVGEAMVSERLAELSERSGNHEDAEQRRADAARARAGAV